MARLHSASTSTLLLASISKYLLALIFLSWAVFLFYYNHIMATLVSCSHDYLVTTPQQLTSSVYKSGDEGSKCQSEYNRLVSGQTQGLTSQDLLRSRTLIGNQYRLERVMKSLSSRERPVVAVVAGGSISLGHGVADPQQHRYSNRLEAWMNEMYPLQTEKGENKHKVINVASHGADSCSMAKRLNVMYTDLSSKLPPTSNNEPDLIILEFAVNDYEGQDHVTQIRHQASVFFDGFLDITLCTEVVIHSLLTRYPSAAIMFLEMQTAILSRKTGSLLHMGVAAHYQIPVISYGETIFHGFS